MRDETTNDCGQEQYETGYRVASFPGLNKDTLVYMSFMSVCISHIVCINL